MKMRAILYLVVFMTVLSWNGMSQSLASQIQSNKWAVKGKLDGSKLVLSSKEGAVSDWDAKFSTDGVLSYCYTTETSVFDATGIEIKPNTYYCDDFNNYELKNDVILIKHTDKSFYYKIKALSDKNGFEFNPATAADFK